MLEAYAVGVKLEMTSNALTMLDKLIVSVERFNRLLADSQTAVGRLTRNLRELGGSQGAVSGLDKLGNAMRSAEVAGAGLSRNMRTNAELAAKTARAMEEAAAAANRIRPLPTSTPGGAPARPGQGGGHGAGRFSEHNIMMTGMGAGIVSGALVDALRHTMTPAIDVMRTRDVLAADTRLMPEQVDAALARARETTKLAPGTTTGENLAALLDLKTVFGDLTEAHKLLPDFARMTALFSALDRKHGGSGEQAFAAAKALEVLAGMVDEKTDANGRTVREINPELGMARLKMMERAAVATNMRVMPSDYLGFAKQARVAGMTLSDEFTYEKLPALLAVLGGPRTGTALMSMAQVFEGGKLTPKSMEELQKIGLAGPGGIEKVGKRQVVHPEAIYDLAMMTHDPLQYLEAAQKRMEAKGIHGSEEQIKALMRAAQRSTIAGLFADLLKDMPAILKEQANIRATRTDMAEHLAAVDPAAKVRQFEAALTNFATALGSAAMEDAMGVLTRVTAALNAFGDWAERNPGTARVMMAVATGLGAIGTAVAALSTAIIFARPALALLGIGGGVGAAVTAPAASAAGAGRMGAVGLSALGRRLGWLGVGSELTDHVAEAAKDGTAPTSVLRLFNRDAYTRRGLVPPGEMGPPPSPSDRPPGTQRSEITINVPLNIDGRKVGEAIARTSLGPSTGATSADVRMGLFGGAGGMP